MIDEDCGCGHKEKPTHMLRKKEEPAGEQPGIRDVLRTALEKAIKQESMNKEKATTFIREVIKKVKGGYKAFSKGGDPLSKKPKSKTGANDQLKAIHANK